MQKMYQVFVSSTYEDMVQERHEISRILPELNCVPVGMELFPESGRSTIDNIKSVIAKSDYYLMLLGSRYGSIAGDADISFTELEYNYAKQLGKPVLVFIKRDNNELLYETKDAVNKLNNFKNTLLSSNLCEYYEKPSDLGPIVAKALITIINNTPAPGWIKNDIGTENSNELSTSEPATSPHSDAYLLTWDPARFPFDNFKEAAFEVQRTGSCIMSWNVGKKGASKGSRVFFMRHGNDNPGLVGSGYIISNVELGKHWDNNKPNNWQTAYAEIKWDCLSEDPIIQLDLLIKQLGQRNLWTKNGSGHPIPDNTAIQLEKLWAQTHKNSEFITQQDENVSSASSELGPTQVEDIAAEDRLGRAILTNALVRLLTVREDARPFTIGLFGHWGSGKSSQIALVNDTLIKLSNEPKVHLIEFNAWSHERASNVAAALAQVIVDSLVDKLSFLDQIKLAAKLAQKRRIKLTESIERDRLRFLHIFIETWLIWSPVLIFLIIFGYYIANTRISHILLASLTSIPTIIATYLAGNHFIGKNLTGWFKKFNFSKSISKFRLPDYSIHLGLYHEIRKNLEMLCNLQLTQDTDPQKGDYLLVVVDDLDRCGPEMVKQVFDAVRLVAHIPRVVTLVSIDERMAFSAVEQYYSKLGHAGREPALVARDYLAKVFQVAINLPPPDDQHVREFIIGKLFTETTELQDTEISNQPLNTEGNHEVSKEVTEHIEAQMPEYTDSAKLITESSLPMSSQNRAVVGEKELFSDLAISYSFSNPRLLWRLMQSWRLLKSIVLLGSYNLSVAEPWMRLLFWREWLFQQTSEIRLGCQEWPITNPSDLIPSKIQEAMPKNTLKEAYQHRCRSIDAVLLPAAPTVGPNVNSTGQIQEVTLMSGLSGQPSARPA